jgi:hypothetical protein
MTMSQKGTGSSNEKDPGTKVDVLLEVGKGSHTLYDALGLTSDASEREIRKAYFAMAVKVHPDRNPGDEKATERFQVSVCAFFCLVSYSGSFCSPLVLKRVRRFHHYRRIFIHTYIYCFRACKKSTMC